MSRYTKHAGFLKTGTTDCTDLKRKNRQLAGSACPTEIPKTLTGLITPSGLLLRNYKANLNPVFLHVLRKLRVLRVKNNFNVGWALPTK
ncbi:MAG: hypothetical protein QY305_06095 [Candidatus Brocadiaceae baterium WH-1]|uniref:hypothetical protein n=1 Tax=Candidatus Loosdrechtia sp. TaxID=3101272 RepID=UPI003A5E15B9|nr:MAG: hypothetical protein QY305_06095 [Candidatus Jettenia sp. AMX2]